MFLKFLKTKGSNVMFVHIHSIETKSEQISTDKVILHFWAIPQINNSEVKIFLLILHHNLSERITTFIFLLFCVSVISNITLGDCLLCSNKHWQSLVHIWLFLKEPKFRFPFAHLNLLGRIQPEKVTTIQKHGSNWQTSHVML